jgi:hypothetical protein
VFLPQRYLSLFTDDILKMNNGEIKVELSHYRPEQAHRVPGTWTNQGIPTQI